MRVLLFLLKSSKKNFTLALITGLLAGASFSGIIALIHLIIQTKLAHFYLYLFGFISAWIGYGIFSPASTYFLSQLSEKAILQLRVKLSQQILESPLNKIEESKSDIFVVLTEDINAIANSLERMPGYFAAIGIVSGCFILMISISPLLYLLLIIMLGLFLPVYLFTLKIMQFYLNKVRQEWNNIFKHFYSLNHGIKELLINSKRRQDFLQLLLYPSCQRQYQEAIKYKTIDVTIARWGELFLVAGLGLCIFILPSRGYITFIQINEFLIILLFTLPHVSTILNFLNQLKRIEVSLKHIEKIVLLISSKKYKDQVIDPLMLQTLASINKSLVIENVTYQYYDREREHPFNFGPVSLSFSTPSIVFITGGNGSGKSTFAKILSGLYAPNSGNIYLNDVKIEDYNRELYCEHFSAIFSNFYLFEDLLGFGNLLLEDKIKDYLTKLELSHKVKIEQGKFSTTKLSQGQRKRLALLTSLLEDKDIYLFDEWASDQDPYFKKIFYYEILADLKARKKLVFVISHDESYYHLADQIIKLEDGKLVRENSNI